MSGPPARQQTRQPHADEDHGRRPRRWAVGAIGLATLGLLAVLATTNPVGPREPDAILGSPVPDTAVTTLAGEEFRLTDLHGGVAIVNVWNSWCGPCRREAPVLERFYDRHADDRDFTMVGLVHDDTPSAVAAWVARRGVPWTIVLDPDKQLAVELAIISQPETYAIDATGRIVAKHYGEITLSQLEALLHRARTLPEGQARS